MFNQNILEIMRNAEVCDLFLHNKRGKTRNLESTGEKLISYCTTIAQRIDGQIVFNKTRYSNSTSKHQHYLRRYDIVVDNVPMNTANLHKFI